jgi:hypothetical protein
MDVLRDSVETAVSLKLFQTREEASAAHIFNSKLMKLPLSAFQRVDNFNPGRLQDSAVKAYPLNDRPRGDADIRAVKFYQKRIQAGAEVDPIWLMKRGKQYVLLDGAHRIVALFIERVPFVYAHVVK